MTDFKVHDKIKKFDKYVLISKDRLASAVGNPVINTNGTPSVKTEGLLYSSEGKLVYKGKHGTITLLAKE